MIRRVELYLRRSGTSATAFGRQAARDPNLVRDLRRGRILQDATHARLSAWLDAAEKTLGRDPCRRR